MLKKIKSKIRDLKAYYYRLFPWEKYKYEIRPEEVVKAYGKKVKCILFREYAKAKRQQGPIYGCCECAFYCKPYKYTCSMTHMCMRYNRTDTYDVIFLDKQTYKKIFHEKYRVSRGEILSYTE